jgi:hypothetical protein
MVLSLKQMAFMAACPFRPRSANLVNPRPFITHLNRTSAALATVEHAPARLNHDEHGAAVIWYLDFYLCHCLCHFSSLLSGPGSSFQWNVVIPSFVIKKRAASPVASMSMIFIGSCIIPLASTSISVSPVEWRGSLPAVSGQRGGSVLIARPTSASAFPITSVVVRSCISKLVMVLGPMSRLAIDVS